MIFILIGVLAICTVLAYLSFNAVHKVQTEDDVYVEPEATNQVTQQVVDELDQAIATSQLPKQSTPPDTYNLLPSYYPQFGYGFWSDGLFYPSVVVDEPAVVLNDIEPDCSEVPVQESSVSESLPVDTSCEPADSSSSYDSSSTVDSGGV